MKLNKKGLGRGLSALIPMEDMEFLSQVARGDFSLAGPVPTQTDSSAEKLAAGLKAGRDNLKSTQKPKPPTPEAQNGRQIERGSRGQSRKGGDVNRTSIEPLTLDSGHLEVIRTAAPRDSFPQPVPAATILLPPSQNEPLSQAKAGATDALTNREGQDTGAGNSVVWLAPELIAANPFQPRRHFDAEELSNLAASVKEHGILQPIIVRPLPDSTSSGSTSSGSTRFQLVAGERRWRAAQEAKLEVLPAIVREVNDQQALELAVIENVQRHDISPLDAALAYRRLASEFQLSQERIALRVGKSRSAIANTLRLLDLPEEVQQAISSGSLSEGHGRAILLTQGEGPRRAAFRRILRDKLSVREAENLARKLNQQESQKGALGRHVPDKSDRLSADINLRNLCEELQQRLGTRLSIKARRRGGQMIIQYSSGEELERIVSLLRSPQQ